MKLQSKTFLEVKNKTKLKNKQTNKNIDEHQYVSQPYINQHIFGQF